MTLKRTDLKDAAILLKAGKIDLVRQILGGSNDPRAVRLLAKLDARFAPAAQDELAEIKQLILQKRFAEAETLLRASNHPKAGYLLEKIALKTSAPKPIETTTPRSRPQSLLKSISGVLSRFSGKA